MTRTARGTILLFVVGLVALITVMVYGFVRGLVLQRSSGQATSMKLLSLQAAQTGSQQATEAILRDFTQNAVTRFDGPARAPFRPHHLPFSRSRGEAQPRESRVIDLQDVSAENLLHEPVWWEQSDATTHTACGYMNYGMSFTQMMDGRGRWIEPGVSGPVAPYPLGSGAWLPALPVRFGDGDAVDVDGAGWYDGPLSAVSVYRNRLGQTTLTPDVPTVDVESVLLNSASGSQCAPLLLDANLRRIPATSRADYLEQRKWARYRLRYACEVRDLDGYLLTNPDLDLDTRDITSLDASAITNQATRRTVRSSNALINVMLPLTSQSGRVSGVPGRLQHVFMGRGVTSNYDRVSDADYWPRSFPFMFRGQLRNGSADVDIWYWFLQGKGNINATSAPWPPYTIASQLYKPVASAAAVPAGGVLLPMPAKGRRDLIGPQYSFFNMYAAVAATDDASQNSPAEYDSDAGSGQWNLLMWTTTPFGRGLTGSGKGRYGGAVETPWHVNLLTAHPLVIRGLVLGALPKGALQVAFNGTGAGGRRSSYSTPLRHIADLHNTSHSPAFLHYGPPTNPTTGVSPDYRMPSELLGEPGFRQPYQRYPGPLLPNGATGSLATWYTPPAGAAAGDAWGDDVGSALTVDAQSWAIDPHMAGENFPGSAFASWPYLRCVQSSTAGGVVEAASPPAKADAPNGTYFPNWRISTNANSVWSDVLIAFNQALAVTRRGYATYEGANYQPRDTDIYHTNAVCRPANLREFDRLFLMCLGHDPDNPAANPVANQAWGGNPPIQFTAAANLYTVAAGAATVTLPDGSGTDRTASWRLRTQAAELAINDFRFSLLGSSPGYSRDFRPLDLNGDGMVAFSGYAVARALATDGSEPDRVAFLIDQDDTAGNGNGLAWPAAAGGWASDSDGDGQISPAEFQAANIVPFCMTGNFFIGRSRYWHVITRGELWDNLKQQPAAQTTLETVLAVDQAEQAEPWPGAPGVWKNGQAFSTQVLFQRQHFNINISRQLRNY